MGPCRDTPTALGWWGPSFCDPTGGAPPCAPLKTTAPLALPPRVPLALTADPPKLEHFNKKTLITWGGREGRLCWVWCIGGHVGGPWGPVMFCLTLPVRRVVPRRGSH